MVGITLILTFFLSKPIGAYQLGEMYAQSMGVNIRVFRVLLILLSSVFSACVTAFAGVDFIRWNRSSVLDQASSRDGKTAGCDTGNIPWRGGVLYGM